MVSEEVVLELESSKPLKVKSNYADKVKLAKTLMDDVRRRKMVHYKMFGTYKKINTGIKGLIHTLNAMSVCSIVVAFTPESPGTMIVALTSTSISGVISAVSTAVDIEGKIHSHNTSYLQYTDLHRDVSARLLRNGMSSNDLDCLLSEINDRMGLIEDASLPIETKRISPIS